MDSTLTQLLARLYQLDLAAVQAEQRIAQLERENAEARHRIDELEAEQETADEPDLESPAPEQALTIDDIHAGLLRKARRRGPDGRYA